MGMPARCNVRAMCKPTLGSDAVIAVFAAILHLMRKCCPCTPVVLSSPALIVASCTRCRVVLCWGCASPRHNDNTTSASLWKLLFWPCSEAMVVAAGVAVARWWWPNAGCARGVPWCIGGAKLPGRTSYQRADRAFICTLLIPMRDRAADGCRGSRGMFFTGYDLKGNTALMVTPSLIISHSHSDASFAVVWRHSGTACGSLRACK